MSDNPIRVLLVDDEPLVRSGLAMLIETEPDIVVVGEADDGAQALALAAKEPPDIVVMDVRTPVMDGVAATRALREAHACAVLVLTTFHDDAAVHEALRAGAAGFLLKNNAPHMLVEAIRALVNGHGWLAPAVTRRLLDDFAARPNPSLPAPEQVRQLTGREQEVLTLIAHGLNNAEIGTHLFISEATVKTHIGRILTKLDLHDRAQAVVAAYKSGLVSPTHQPPVGTTQKRGAHHADKAP